MISDTLLAAFTAILMASCSAAPHAEQGDVASKPWRIELTTAGGIAGKGTGALTASSTQDLTLTSMTGKRCEFTLTDTETGTISTILEDAAPSAWSQSYVPEDPCCDRIEYEMTISIGGEIHSVVWIDDPLPMPEDLRKLVNAITAGPDNLRAKYAERCR
jgi:hypothetical protein